MCFYHIQFPFPFQSHSGKYLFQIYLVLCKLAHPFPDAVQVVEQLTGESTVFCRRNKSFDLRGCSGNQDGKKALFNFPVFLIRTAVVRQAVVVERFAERVAPVAVIRAYGSGKGIRFGFTDKSCSFGIHDILQDTRAGIITGNEKHPVGRNLRSFHFSTLFAHCFVSRFLSLICFHLYGHFCTNLVVDRFYEQPDIGKDTFAGSGRSDDETLHTGILVFTAIRTTHIPFHGRT